MHRMSKGSGPSRPITPNASKRAEDVLKHTRLDVSFTAANLEFLADLKRKAQSPLPRTKAIQLDSLAVERVLEVKIKIQTDGDGEKEVRRRHQRAVPDPSSALPLVDGNYGAIGSRPPLHQLQEDNSHLLDEVMHQQDRREQLKVEKDQLEQQLQYTALQHAEALAEAVQAKKALQQQTRSQTVVMPAGKEHKPQQYKIRGDYATWAANFQAVVTKNGWSEEEATFNL